MKRRSFIKSLSTTSITLPFAGCSVLSGRRLSKYLPDGEMPMRILGKTGIKVSMLGFGSHINKELIKKPVYRDKMIKLGYEGGINLYDVYDHKLEVEHKQFKPMGKSIRGFRKNVIVSLVAVKSTDQMQDEIDGALRDFNTDYIDLYRLYSIDDDRMNIMEKNKKAGKIRAIGIVDHEVEKFMKYIGRYGSTIDYVMIIYNFPGFRRIVIELN